MIASYDINIFLIFTCTFVVQRLFVELRLLHQLNWMQDIIIEIINEQSEQMRLIPELILNRCRQTKNQLKLNENTILRFLKEAVSQNLTLIHYLEKCHCRLKTKHLIFKDIKF